MKVKRGVFAVKQGESTVGAKSRTPWGRKERRNIGGVSHSNVCHIEPAAAAPVADVNNNTPKSILKNRNHECHIHDALASMDHVPIKDNHSVCTDDAMKKVRWDSNVKENNGFSFSRLNKGVIEDLKGLAIGLDNKVQKVREKLQCGNMQCANIAVANDFYCASPNGKIVCRPCGSCAAAVDGFSLGSNDLADDESTTVPSLVDEQQEKDNKGVLRDDDPMMMSREESVEETEDKYQALVEEDRENQGPAAKAQHGTAIMRENRGTLVQTNPTPNYHPRPAHATFKSVGRAQKNPPQVKSPTNTGMTASPTKKASKHGKRKQDKVRYTTRQPTQKKGLKGALVKPVKVMAAGFKMSTRKLLTS